jgi:hypothetical protein
VFSEVCAFQIKRYQVIGLRLNCFEKEVGLFDRIARFAVVVSAPLVAALLRLNFSIRVLPVDAIANRRAMNNGDNALVGCELVPIDVVTFEGIDHDGDVRILPGFVEFGGLGEGGRQTESCQEQNCAYDRLHVLFTEVAGDCP